MIQYHYSQVIGRTSVLSENLWGGTISRNTLRSLRATARTHEGRSFIVTFDKQVHVGCKK